VSAPHGYPIDDIMSVILNAPCQTEHPMGDQPFCTGRHAYCIAVALAEGGYMVDRVEDVVSGLSTILEDTAT
jgi:hypothetical protein